MDRVEAGSGIGDADRQRDDGLPNADRVMDHALALPTCQWMSNDAGRVVEATRAWLDSIGD